MDLSPFSLLKVKNIDFSKINANMFADCMNEIDAQRILGYALYKDGKSARLSYPLEQFHADVAGRSFHNGRFVQRMREKAASLPKYSLLSFPSTIC